MGLSVLDSHSCCVGTELLWNFIMDHEIPSIGWEARWAGPVRIGWEGWIKESGLTELYRGYLSRWAGWAWLGIALSMDIVDSEFDS